MAKQIDVLNIYIQHVRQADGTYVTSLAWDGAVSDPAGANQAEKSPSVIRKNETYDGNKNGATIVTECFDSAKTEGGVA